MSDKAKVRKYKNLRNLVTRFRDDLREADGGCDYVLLFAYNGTGKTRLSMEFKETGKRKKDSDRDTLYFNAYTEDLFFWDNDLAADSDRFLKFNEDSQFFAGFKQLALEERIESYLVRYADFTFNIEYDQWRVSFSKEVDNPKYHPDNGESRRIMLDNIKISRGEENIFIWCIYLSICELVIDGEQAYDWVRYFYIDDPISSLDDNNAIAVATDLATLLKKGDSKIKSVISSHHGLFFNVICNELKKKKHKKYFLHPVKDDGSYSLQATNDTPFFHHVAMLTDIRKAAASGDLYTHHFNMLRSILERTATFFGFKDFSECIHGLDDEVLFARALNLLSHGKYSVFDPVEMGEDNKQLFRRILNGFLDRYKFDLPDLNP